MSNILKQIKKMNIMEMTEKAELSFEMTKKTLEIINEINQKINTIIIPKIEEIEKQLKYAKEIFDEFIEHEKPESE